MTYAELNEQADTLAATLESLVTGPEPVIVVCLNRQQPARHPAFSDSEGGSRAMLYRRGVTCPAFAASAR